MLRTCLVLLWLALVTISGGCAMCHSEYDDCYPAYGGSCCDDRVPCSRAGSAFGPPAPEEEPQPVAQPQ